MDPNKSVRNPNPRENANPISVILWWWTVSLFKKGYGKVLGPEDLYQPLKEDKSNILGDRLEAQWLSELKKSKIKNSKPSFLKAIIRTFFIEYFYLGVFCFFNEVILCLVTPLLLGSLLGYFRPNPSTTYEKALFFAGGILLGYLLRMLITSQLFFEAVHLGGKVRIAVCSVVYRKALKLSRATLGEIAPGKIVNLIANDVNRFETGSIFIHFMWSSPLLTLIIGVIIYKKAGYAGLIGIATILIVVPIQAYTGKLFAKYRFQTALKTDERVRLMDEIISIVQTIKMYAWEKAFCDLVELARRVEIKVIRKSSFLRGIFITFGLFTTRVAIYSTLMGILILNDDVTAEKVFVFSSFFNLISLSMTNCFARSFAETKECLVGIGRLQKFLVFKEFSEGNFINNIHLSVFDGSIYSEKEKIPNYELMSEKDPKDGTRSSTQIIDFDNFSATWDTSSEKVALQDINIEIEKGKFYMVIGMVGAGKSSFLSAILREMVILNGEVRVNGKVSYADQDAWVFGASVRQNILFGQEFDRHRYQKVVKVCALLKDFEQFPQGDQTLVGERGSSLSGGQKARINLARAVYRQADVYLLDDPLSAVDAHIGKHLFEDCLQRYLKGKTRILVTHQLQFIKGVDSIIFLDQGRVQQYSDYLDLLRDNPEYKEIISAEHSSATVDQCVSEKTLPGREVSGKSTMRKSSNKLEAQKNDNRTESSETNLMTSLKKTSRGSVKGNLVFNYFKSGGNLCVIYLIILLFLFTQVIVSFNDYFMQVFVSAEESRTFYKNANCTNVTKEDSKLLPKSEIRDRDFYILIYSIAISSILFVGLTRTFVFYSVCMRCSQRLHDFMFSALIRAKMRFYDTNPSGRILNRFSKDIGEIDELLPKALLDAAQILLETLGALIGSCIVNPILLAPTLVMALIFYVLRNVYLKTSKNIKRLEGIAKSPVFTHLSATLNGISTIRAYGAQSILRAEFDNLQNNHTSAWYMFIATSSAHNFALDFFTFVFFAIVVFSFLLLNNSFSSGEVGLVITQVMSSVVMIQWGMRKAAEVTNQSMTVERVLEYTQIPSESNLRNKGLLNIENSVKDRKEQSSLFAEIPKAWPIRGHIEFKSVCMRYSEDDAPVLKNLTVNMLPSEKVGIVGRTGAGKSSLISALFRIAKVEGAIEIDGIDTGTVALEDLRKSISIIPQLPVLFSGTLRRNLDPFEEYSDELLWKVLEDVELKDIVIGSGNGLGHHVFDRGTNYSVGQRQLICLARAILRNNRILVLDEATANVDPQTDALIQKTIRTKFAECTILTVAHRLNTIIDSDKVLVMDKGLMVEYDHPHRLLQNPDGHFTSLVRETGLDTSEQLRTIAHNAYMRL